MRSGTNYSQLHFGAGERRVPVTVFRDPRRPRAGARRGNPGGGREGALRGASLPAGLSCWAKPSQHLLRPLGACGGAKSRPLRARDRDDG